MIGDQEYPSEKHTIQTDDGYILSVYRIPKIGQGHNQSNRKVILLMHGTVLSMSLGLSLAKITIDALNFVIFFLA